MPAKTPANDIGNLPAECRKTLAKALEMGGFPQLVRHWQGRASTCPCQKTAEAIRWHIADLQRAYNLKYGIGFPVLPK